MVPVGAFTKKYPILLLVYCSCIKHDLDKLISQLWKADNINISALLCDGQFIKPCPIIQSCQHYIFCMNEQMPTYNVVFINMKYLLNKSKKVLDLACVV